MTYLKSVVGGILGILLFACVFVAIVHLIFPEGWAIAPTGLLKRPLFWVLVLLFFSAGFYLQLRRGR